MSPCRGSKSTSANLTLELGPWDGDPEKNIVSYQSALALAAENGGNRNTGANWNAKLLVNYRMPKDWGIQVNGEYESARIQPQE